MTKYLVFLIALLAGCQTVPTAPETFVVDRHTIQIIGKMDESLMAEPLKEIQKADADEVVNIYIFSMGGDPRVSAKLVAAMKGKRTICYAHAAVGPAFTVFQACSVRVAGERLITGTRHIALPKNADLDLRDEAMRLQKASSALEADRIGVSREEYKPWLKDGFLWFSASQGIDNNGVDAAAEFECAAGLQHHDMSRVIFLDTDGDKPAETTLTMSMCPIGRVLIYPELSGSELGEIIGIPMIR